MNHPIIIKSDGKISDNIEYYDLINDMRWKIQAEEDELIFKVLDDLAKSSTTK
jgi:hypothetical protein